MADKKELNAEVLTNETTALSTGVQGLVGFTKTKTGLTKVLADENAKRLLMTTVTTFINVDMRFTTGMKAIGEICVNILDKEEDLQRKVIHALCEAQGITPIEETGRKGLAMALFAKFPDMQQQVKGGKDTKGALRLSSYMAAFKADKGTDTGGRAMGTPNANKPRSASDLFQKLYLACTAKEQSILVRVAGRAGIEYEDWLPEEDGEASE